MLAQVLEEQEAHSCQDHLGDIEDIQQQSVARLCRMEVNNRQLQDCLETARVQNGAHKIGCPNKAFIADLPGRKADCLCVGIRALSPSGNADLTLNPDGTVVEGDEVLQTKTVPNEVVRAELPRWLPSIEAEYRSLTQESRAVRPLSEADFQKIISDPNVQHELVPGRAIFTVKAHTGRLKTRVVACGNFQTSAARSKEDKFASGISAEATRMLLRLAGLRSLKVGVLDIKTAFLNAPVVTPNQETVIVRVPSILRASGVCSEKFWIVDKALYGLDVAPRSWSLHRNGVLAAITKLESSNRSVRCLPMEEDANIWTVVDTATDSIIAYLALYVDDILIVGDETGALEIAQTLEGKWTTTPVSWASPYETLSFDGFEVDMLDGEYHVHQKSYVRELLKQYHEVEGSSLIPCPKELPSGELAGTKSELIKQAQCLTGQLLWLSGRTRPDIAYAVSAMGRAIVQDPSETILRGHHLIRFVRQSSEVSIRYGKAPNDYGRWGQLQWKQTEGAIDVFSDASFMTDQESRSIGSAQMFWAGAIVMWNCGKQPILSASTAEAELISLADAFTMGRSLRPLIEAFCTQFPITCHAGLYTDNSAALQLCTLDAGSWRTRHLRLRGNMIRQATERGEWSAAHIEGVYMPADIGTKPVGPTRFEDLVHLVGLHCPNLPTPNQPSSPKVAALKTGVARLLIALILWTQATTVQAQPTDGVESWTVSKWFFVGFALGFGGYMGWNSAKTVHKWVANCICPRRPVTSHQALGAQVPVSSPRLDLPQEPQQAPGAQQVPVSSPRLDLPQEPQQAPGAQVPVSSPRLDLPQEPQQAPGAQVPVSSPRLDLPQEPQQAPCAQVPVSSPQLDLPQEPQQAPGAQVPVSSPRLDLPQEPQQAPCAQVPVSSPRLDLPQEPHQAPGVQDSVSSPRLDLPQEPQQVPGAQVAVSSPRLDLPQEPQQAPGAQDPVSSPQLDLLQEPQQAPGAQDPVSSPRLDVPQEPHQAPGAQVSVSSP